MSDTILDWGVHRKAYTTTPASPVPAAACLYRALRAQPDPSMALEAYRRQVPEPIYAVSRRPARM